MRPRPRSPARQHTGRAACFAAMSKTLKTRLSLGALVAAALALSIGAVILMGRYEGTVSAFGAVGGDDAHLAFQLVDHTGAPRRAAEFRGDWVLAYYGYTSCPDICPGTLAAMADALTRLGPAGEAITPLFLSVDPERDTVAAMAAYVDLFHPRLIGLTGSRTQTDAAARAARARHERVEAASSIHYLVDHTAEIYLFGPDGAVVDRLPHSLKPDAIAARIRHAMDAG